MKYPRIRHALFVAACLAGVAQAQSVAPPPLPIGSNLVRPEPGMNESERKRATRAHHHKYQVKKDYTRDDSVYGHESLTATSIQPGALGSGTSGAGLRTGGTAGMQGGNGTGPVREKTDKGASSYFFGNDKNKK